MAAIVALLVFGVVAAVLGPLSEVDVTPIREYREAWNAQYSRIKDVVPSARPSIFPPISGVTWNLRVIVVSCLMLLSGFLWG
jgi:hypothetical protein